MDADECSKGGATACKEPLFAEEEGCDFATGTDCEAYFETISCVDEVEDSFQQGICCAIAASLA